MSPTRFVLVAAMVLAGGQAVGGPLDPPSGAIAPTLKHLGEIEPRVAINAANTPGDATAAFKITQPGSYYLAGDVVGEPGKHGILVATGAPPGFVSIDLNGYRVRGVGGSKSGIVSPSRVLIHDGFVDSWDQSGIDISQGIVRDVVAIDNALNGIHAAWGSLVARCVAESNGQDGISVGDVSRIESCVSKVNVRWGIHADGAAAIADCVVYNNLVGIECGLSVVSGCQVFTNETGILDRGGSLVAGNAVQSALVGIRVTGQGSRIEDNTIDFGATGVKVEAAGNLVVRNSVHGATTSFDALAGNSVGPVVTSATIATTENPHANYEF